MSKTAFIFPGQGAQYVSMGKDFYDAIPLCKEIFEKASSASGLDVEKLCFEENDQINITEYTQIAMLTTEVAIFKGYGSKRLKGRCDSRLEPWRIWCFGGSRCYGIIGFIPFNSKKRHFYAGGISSRWCNDSRTGNGRR